MIISVRTSVRIRNKTTDYTRTHTPESFYSLYKQFSLNAKEKPVESGVESVYVQKSVYTNYESDKYLGMYAMLGCLDDGVGDWLYDENGDRYALLWLTLPEQTD